MAWRSHYFSKLIYFSGSERTLSYSKHRNLTQGFSILRQKKKSSLHTQGDLEQAAEHQMLTLLYIKPEGTAAILTKDVEIQLCTGVRLCSYSFSLSQEALLCCQL